MKELILLFVAFYAICAVVWFIVVFLLCITTEDNYNYSIEETFLLSLHNGIIWPYSIFKYMKL